MGIPLRLLLLAAFAWIGFILFREADIQAHAVSPDNSKVVLLFAGAILDGSVIALILTLLVVPAIGERIGAFFFNPGEQIEHDAHSDAIAKLAQGDPEGAIADYRKILEKEPEDTLAISEIARICCRDLGDTARAATFLEARLGHEWPQQQGSFIANRLVDVYLLQDDPSRARELLLELAASMEGTKYSANALHRIHEIDRAIEGGTRAPIHFEGLAAASLEPGEEEDQRSGDAPARLEDASPGSGSSAET